MLSRSVGLWVPCLRSVLPSEHLSHTFVPSHLPWCLSRPPDRARASGQPSGVFAPSSASSLLHQGSGECLLQVSPGRGPGRGVGEGEAQRPGRLGPCHSRLTPAWGNQIERKGALKSPSANPHPCATSCVVRGRQSFKYRMVLRPAGML